MHYDKNAFSKAYGLVTIQTLNPAMQNVIGNRKGLSEGKGFLPAQTFSYFSFRGIIEHFDITSFPFSFSFR